MLKIGFIILLARLFVAIFLDAKGHCDLFVAGSGRLLFVCHGLWLVLSIESDSSRTRNKKNNNSKLV
jgi:hypothetical protein